ncbi:unnamed protein product [Darwinula stevensoni]|uniref:G-protein coupled receptors family 1 profile domain-containing protein n=1 Tax=Darwinula stevensoni TaxID=69355 RepID=A0A7R9A5B1_9CRUS|nr:unnamed protein product [Darwinula stevensoni]CAG0891699.1 unnamed protein product [Darwinula stevensoni]
MVAHGCNQSAAQRYCSLKKLSTAIKAYLWNAPLSIILWVLAAFSGLVVFANYANCDPLKAGVLTKKDQIIPYYVMDKLGHVHGLPGIFLACLFSGALSTLSSGLNSLAAVTYVDGIMLTSLRKKLTDFQASVLTKCLALGYGIIAMGLSFVLSRLKLGVTTIAIIFASMTQSPLAAVFIASMYLPFVNKYGAFLGLLTGMSTTGWLAIGARVHGVPPEPPLPSSVDGCPPNFTLVEGLSASALYDNFTSLSLSDPAPPSYPHVYDMSYLMLGPIGFSSAFVTCIVVSLITGGYPLALLDETLIVPTALRFYKKLRGLRAFYFAGMESPVGPNWMRASLITWLEPPGIRNETCDVKGTRSPTGGEYAEVGAILALSFWTLIANTTFLATLLSQKHSRFLNSQPRFLLASLAFGNVAMGGTVGPLAVYPTLYGCWPFGEVVCCVQALLVGALSQQNAATLIALAFDRFLCILHPVKYHRLLSRKGSLVLVCSTWILSFTLYVGFVLPGNGYVFRDEGFAMCEPFYATNSLSLLAACLFYFPPTMALFYCYGSVFQLAHVRFKKIRCSSAAKSETFGGRSLEKLVIAERRRNMASARSLASVSVAFILVVTPWTLKQVIVSCTGIELPSELDFAVTWLALSNSFWNVIVFALTSRPFRQHASQLLCLKICGRLQQQSRSGEEEGDRDGEPSSSLPSPRQMEKLHVDLSRQSSSQPDLEDSEWTRHGERFWGQILERTVSCASLQALTRDDRERQPTNTVIGPRFIQNGCWEMTC